jgi:hypothetical protein
VRERAALEQTVALAQQQLAEVNERHRADAARLEELQRECARLAEQLQVARRESVETADVQLECPEFEVDILTDFSDLRRAEYYSALRDFLVMKNAGAISRGRLPWLQLIEGSRTVQLSRLQTKSWQHPAKR